MNKAYFKNPELAKRYGTTVNTPMVAIVSGHFVEVRIDGVFKKVYKNHVELVPDSMELESFKSLCLRLLTQKTTTRTSEEELPPSFHAFVKRDWNTVGSEEGDKLISDLLDDLPIFGTHTEKALIKELTRRLKANVFER